MAATPPPDVPTHIKIWSPDGKLETHPRQNAIDLIEHCGWKPDVDGKPKRDIESNYIDVAGTQMVRIWSPEGKSELHLPANARELIEHMKWRTSPPSAPDVTEDDGPDERAKLAAHKALAVIEPPKVVEPPAPKPVETPRPPVKATPFAELSLDECRAYADANGIAYDHRASLPKLRAILEASQKV